MCLRIWWSEAWDVLCWSSVDSPRGTWGKAVNGSGNWGVRCGEQTRRKGATRALSEFINKEMAQFDRQSGVFINKEMVPFDRQSGVFINKEMAQFDRQRKRRMEGFTLASGEKVPWRRKGAGGGGAPG